MTEQRRSEHPAAQGREAVADAKLIGHYQDAVDALKPVTRGQRLLAFVRRHLNAKRTEEALWSWQQTCDGQEMELASLRGVALHAQQVVDSFDRKPTEGNVRDVMGLAESLRRYREMRDGSTRPHDQSDCSCEPEIDTPSAFCSEHGIEGWRDA